LRETSAYINRIATAVPEHDVYDVFVIYIAWRAAPISHIAIRSSTPGLAPVNFRRMTRMGFIGQATSPTHAALKISPRRGPPSSTTSGELSPVQADVHDKQ